LLAKGDQALKTSLQATLETIEKVQHQVVETAQHGVQSLRSATEKDAQISLLERTISEITLKNNQLIEDAAEEKRLRLAAEVELISTRLQREKDIKRLTVEIARLEQILSSHQIEYQKSID
jgi:molecular chaperone GrpE (heat shock protein)